jgi:hypothetical protein
MAIEPFAPGDFRVFGEPRQDAALAACWSDPDYARAARGTFGALRECFRLR